MRGFFFFCSSKIIDTACFFFTKEQHATPIQNLWCLYFSSSFVDSSSSVSRDCMGAFGILLKAKDCRWSIRHLRRQKPARDMDSAAWGFLSWCVSFCCKTHKIILCEDPIALQWIIFKARSCTGQCLGETPVVLCVGHSYYYSHAIISNMVSI